MKSQQRGLLIAVILLLIMGGFIYGIKRGEPPTKPFQYNGFNILPVKQEGYRGYNIEVYINDIPYPESLLIRYDPKSVEDIPIEANLNEIIQKKVVFVAIDPTDTRLKGRTTVAAMELNDNIEKSTLSELIGNLSQLAFIAFGGKLLRGNLNNSRHKIDFL